MSLKLEDIKGLGKKTVELLTDAGISSVEKLADSSLDDLLAIKGVGKASAQKYIDNAKELLGNSEETITNEEPETSTTGEAISEEKGIEEAVKEEIKRKEEKEKKLKGKKVESGDFVLVKITAKTQKGKIFRVSAVEDAKRAGIYEEEKEKQGYYTPEFVIVGKSGFVNEGLTETIQDMNYFEKKSVRIPTTKAFGKRDPKKIERIGIAKFRKLNEGKNPEIGQDFTKKGQGTRGIVTNILQGKVIVDYNHPLAGQSIDYNLEIIDKIETFEDKIKHFVINKGIPEETFAEFVINHNNEDKTIEITIPKMLLFQNLTYFKFGLAMDLQTHLADEINDVKFIEVYEKINVPTPAESVAKKVEEYTKEQEEDTKSTGEAS